MNIYLIGDLVKNMPLGSQLESRFPEHTLHLVESLPAEDVMEAVVLSTEPVAELSDRIISITYGDVPSEDAGRTFVLMDQYEDLEVEIRRNLRELEAKRQPPEEPAVVPERQGLDSNLFSLEGGDDDGFEDEDSHADDEGESLSSSLLSSGLKPVEDRQGLSDPPPGLSERDLHTGGGAHGVTSDLFETSGGASSSGEFHEDLDTHSGQDRHSPFSHSEMLLKDVDEQTEILNMDHKRDLDQLQHGGPDFTSTLSPSEPQAVHDPLLLEKQELGDVFLVDDIEQGDDDDDLIANILGTGGESTAPGILVKNNKRVERPSGRRAKTEVEVEERQVFDAAISLRELMEQGFSGILEASLKGEKVVLFWHKGQLGDVEGIAATFSRLLVYSGTDPHLTKDMHRRGTDPITYAIKRKLIKESEVLLWLERCRQEVFFDLFLEGQQYTIDPSLSFSLNFKLPLRDPLDLILRGVMEHYSPALAFVRGGGLDPVAVEPVMLARLFELKEVDPLWIRAVSLFSGQDLSWNEAVIRSGLSEEEGAVLSFALRLVGAMTPPVLTEVNDLEIERERVIGILERCKKGDLTDAIANSAELRRRKESVRLQIASMDSRLRALMENEIQDIFQVMEEME